ncbi:hypothetical protein R1sor_010026 [Riccia sorocarpa]|uniref:F-box/kelch-repeat protein n=1 Tax=Riccia sorocarpa TaxID=122646 RepID=A0ABD3I0D2_9MARC
MERDALGAQLGHGCFTSQAERLGVLQQTDGTYEPPEFDMEAQQTANVEMDPSVWSELPEHLMDNILVWLPLPSFLRISKKSMDGEHLKLQVYDSVTNSWQLTDSFRRRVALVVGTAYMQEILYCLTFGPGIGVSTYHVERGCWDDLGARMPSCLTCPQLFVNRGSLMMVGGIEEFGSIKSIHVWRLDSGEREWSEVLSMPDNLLHELSSGPPGGHFLFVAHGDHICFTYYRAKEMLMCNLYKNLWWWLPRCTLDDYLDARSVLGFSLEPRLDAVV